MQGVLEAVRRSGIAGPPFSLLEFVRKYSVRNLKAALDAEAIANLKTRVADVPIGLNVPDHLNNGDRFIRRQDRTRDRIPQVKSQNGQAGLVLQSDGNLVLFRTDTGAALWASKTNGRGVESAKLQSADGNLVLFDKNKTPVFGIGWEGHRRASVILQNDANLVQLDEHGAPVNATVTDGFRDATHDHEPGWFEDIFIAFAEAADAAFNETVELLHKLPGIDETGELLKKLAREPWGEGLLRALANNLSFGLGQIIGPQLGAVVLAAPGLLKGQEFGQAFVDQQVWNVKQFIRIFGGDLVGDLTDEAFLDIAPEPVKRWFDEFQKQLEQADSSIGQQLTDAHIGLEDFDKVSEFARSELQPQFSKFAREAGISEFAFQSSLDRFTRTPSFIAFDTEDVSQGRVFDAFQYEMASGKRTSTVD